MIQIKVICLGLIFDIIFEVGWYFDDVVPEITNIM